KPDILIVTPQNIGKGYESSNVAETMGRGCAEKSEGLAAQFHEIAQLTGCRYLDANAVIASPPNGVDYMHLTKDGHRELAGVLGKLIREIK
nr:lipolytic enzyme, G-D-S-L [Lachnospiraceae bacterium]